MNTTPPQNEPPKPRSPWWKVIWPLLASLTVILVITAILCELSVHKMISRDNYLIGSGSIYGALAVVSLIAIWKAYKQ